MSEWISVTERLPDTLAFSAAPVLACVGINGLQCVVNYCMPTIYAKYGKWLIAASPNKDLLGVTHWMPLPEAPKYEPPPTTNETLRRAIDQLARLTKTSRLLCDRALTDGPIEGLDKLLAEQEYAAKELAKLGEALDA